MIDLAIGREHGIPLLGPAPGEVLPEIPRKLALTALMEALTWFERNEGDSAQTVLAACRAWAYAREGVWLSKTAAARWASAQSDAPGVIEEALERRTGRLDPDAVERVIDDVRKELARR